MLLKFVLITNIQGEILYSEYFAKQINEQETQKEIQNVLLKKTESKEVNFKNQQNSNVLKYPNLYFKTINLKNASPVIFFINDSKITFLNFLQHLTLERYIKFYLNSFEKMEEKKILPQKFEDYEFFEELDGKKNTVEFIYKIKLKNKENEYVMKGSDLEITKEYPIYEKELTTALFLDHPNIIKHHTWFKTKYTITMFFKMTKMRYCLVMDFEKGGDLYQAIKKRNEPFTKEVTKFFDFFNIFLIFE